MAFLTTVTSPSPYPTLLPTLIALGIGLGLLTTSPVAGAVAAVPHDTRRHEPEA
ncbi:hypothetical protein ACH5A3_32695 [Streptomyces echinatus]|uniref:hypothetical protein n=1 Tax=Streptomyces echinatus TaxID=67293 RepID=UPI0037B81177